MKKILVTGTAGFILSNFMRMVERDNASYKFVSIDKVIAPYNRYNVELNRKSHNFYMGDIADEKFIDNIFAIERPDIVIHGAAESFVDDSIKSAGPFIHSNVVGTQVMVDAAVKYGVERFVYISTDEVYGQLKSGEKSWTEESLVNPRNPYSASKAAGELIVKAANQTHGLKYNITRCCNNYGPSLVPRIIYSAINNKSIGIHGNGLNMREWICAEDHCRAIMHIVENLPVNEIYNIGTGIELSNLDMLKYISKVLNKKIEHHFVKDRAGHDFRYSVDVSKIAKTGWKPRFSFEGGMKKCVDWYVENSWYFKNFDK